MNQIEAFIATAADTARLRVDALEALGKYQLARAEAIKAGVELGIGIRTLERELTSVREIARAVEALPGEAPAEPLFDREPAGEAEREAERQDAREAA